jgi:hypothetical protein
MAKQGKYSRRQKQEFLALIERHGGNIHRAVQAFRSKYANFERKTWYNWLESDSFVKDAYDEYLENEIDDAEALHKLHRNGMPIRNDGGEIIGWTLRPSLQAIEFYLKTKGRSRGYVSAQDIQHHFPEQIIGFDIIVDGDEDSQA